MLALNTPSNACADLFIEYMRAIKGLVSVNISREYAVVQRMLVFHVKL